MSHAIKINVKTLAEIKGAPKPDWIIERFLPRKGVAVIGGAPKSNKSFLALQTIVDGLQGRPAFKRFATNIKRAVMFNAEGGFWILCERETAWKALPAASYERVRVSDTLVKVTLGGRLLHEAAIQAVCAEFAAFAPDVLLFDPLIRYHTADENKNEEMDHVCEAFARIARTLDTGVLLVHHTNKASVGALNGTPPGGQDLRGASSLFGAADAVAVIRRGQGHERTVWFNLRHSGDDEMIEARWNPATLRLDWI